MAEYCIRGLNTTIPPSHTGVRRLGAAGRPAKQMTTGTIKTASRNTPRWVGEEAEKSVVTQMMVMTTPTVIASGTSARGFRAAR
jgi:hypothetical protein